MRLFGLSENAVRKRSKDMEEQEKRQRRPAIGYMRTSSAANVGEGKDSEVRQRKPIQTYANRAGYKIVDWQSDPAVSGADPIDVRPGFAAVLEKIAGNGVSTIIVETANRFARDLMVQEAGYERLRSAGITLIAADEPDSFVDDSPTAVLVRQILGAVAQFDRAMTVAELRGARERPVCVGLDRLALAHLTILALANVGRAAGSHVTDRWPPLPFLLFFHILTSRQILT
jgi:hypothetical protein